jgi:hypothetical protein
VQFESYFNQLKNSHANLTPLGTLVMNRVEFDTIYYVFFKKNTEVKQLTTHLSSDIVLSTHFYPQDTTDLPPALLAAGGLVYLTFGGIAFSEDARIEEIRKIRQSVLSDSFRCTFNLNSSKIHLMNKWQHF